MKKEKTSEDNFLNTKVEKAFINILETALEDDLSQVLMPKSVVDQIRVLDTIRKEIDPAKFDKYLPTFLMTRQTEIANARYLIGRHISILKGGQSYAFIFRKFQTADQYNKTKERLEKTHPDKRATTGEIDNEIEKGLLTVRKTEVAYQVASDKLECLLKWCDNMIMIIQNKVREDNTDRRTQYAGNNTPNRA